MEARLAARLVEGRLEAHLEEAPRGVHPLHRLDPLHRLGPLHRLDSPCASSQQLEARLPTR